MWKWLLALVVGGGLFLCAGGAGAAGWWLWSERQVEAAVAEAAEVRAAEAARAMAEETKATETRGARMEEARAALAAGDHARAIDAYSDVLEGEPANAEALFGRGRSYAKLDRLDLAETDLREAVRLDPTNREGWASLGWVLGRNGRDAEAVAALDRLVALDENDATARRDRANARFRAGDVEGAKDDAARACSLGLADGCALEEKIRAATRR